MKIKLIAICFCLAATLAPAQSTKAPVSRRTASAVEQHGVHERAEDALDCLDGAYLVVGKNDETFWPQSLACRAMVRKLQRAAATQEDHATVDALLEYQSQISVCRVSGGVCPDVNVARNKAIQAGGLRAPDAAGR